MSRLSFRGVLHPSFFCITIGQILTNRIAVARLCEVPRFRCDVSKLLQLFFVMTPRKLGKIKGVQWSVLVKSQIICLIWLKLYRSSVGFDWSPKRSKSNRLALTDGLPIINSMGKPYRPNNPSITDHWPRYRFQTFLCLPCTFSCFIQMMKVSQFIDYRQW